MFNVFNDFGGLSLALVQKNMVKFRWGYFLCFLFSMFSSMCVGVFLLNVLGLTLIFHVCFLLFFQAD